MNYKLTLLSIAAILGSAFPSLSYAQPDADGSNANWYHILNTTIVESGNDSQNSYTTSNLQTQGIITNSGSGNYGWAKIDTYARPTANQELKAYSRVELQSLGADITSSPTRVNADSLAFLGERWTTQASPTSGLAPGSVFPAFAQPAWDGTLKVDVPGFTLPLTSPNFNEVGVNFDFRLFELDANFPNSDPIPVLEYFSSDLVLRANGTDTAGDLFLTGVSKFDTDVTEYDPTNPYTPTGNTHSMTLTATPVTMASGVGFDIELGGDLIPFSAELGKTYMVTYGMGVYANVTGAEGFAEADFFNTGTVSLISNDPNASFAVVPEPTTFALLLTSLGVLANRRKRL